jgi:hypothetical protein
MHLGSKVAEPVEPGGFHQKPTRKNVQTELESALRVVREEECEVCFA